MSANKNTFSRHTKILLETGFGQLVLDIATANTSEIRYIIRLPGRTILSGCQWLFEQETTCLGLSVQHKVALFPHFKMRVTWGNICAIFHTADTSGSIKGNIRELLPKVNRKSKHRGANETSGSTTIKHKRLQRLLTYLLTYLLT